MPLISRNPANEIVTQTFEALDSQAIENKLIQAQSTFNNWKQTTFSERSALMKQAAFVLRNKKSYWAKIITEEMGMLYTKAQASIEKCAWTCEYYADHAETFLQKEYVETDADRSYVRFDPLGVILAVMPWNYPFWQVIRFAAPALMAGNVGILKHASNVPRCALALEEVFLEAGFPQGCFQSLLIGSDQVEAIIQDERVKAVTLTGSEYAGSKVASQAAAVIKHSVLELGGSDPFIVLADANIQEAAKVGAAARLMNSGQSCIAAKRFIIHESVYDEFIQYFLEQFQLQTLGDPMDEETTIGPLATESILEEAIKQVETNLAMGAKALIGGKKSDIQKQGYFYEPTILVDVTENMPAYHEEIFAPVATVFKVKDENEAIALANASPFGLGAALWTQDMQNAEKLARSIDSGAVFINGFTKSDPRLPFGGIKRSGYGRELSHYGIKEFVNVKTIWLKS